jgi:heme/copper-type cytochrome/quinol oxidase subunit 4
VAGEEFLIGAFMAVSAVIWGDLEIRSLDAAGQKRNSLKAICAYFLASLLCFAVCALAYFAIIQTSLTLLYENNALFIVEMFSFGTGLVTLAFGAWGLHQTGLKGERALKVPRLRIPIIVALLTTLNTIVLVDLLNFAAEIHDILIDGLAALCVLSYVGFFLTLTKWSEKRLKVIGLVLVVLPWVFTILVAIIIRI